MLEDTSFAIHPGQEHKILNADYKELGRITKVSQIDNVAVLTTETGDLCIKFYREDIVRFVINPFGETSLKSSPALTTTGEKVEVSIVESEKDVIIQSKLLTVLVDKFPVRVTVKDSNGNILTKQSGKGMGYKESKEVLCYTNMSEEDHFYGFGEKTGFLDKRGEKMVMWNTDVYAPHNPETDSLYQSIPYFMTLKNGLAFGTFFDNTFKTTFDLRSESDHYSFKAEGGQIDYYIMAGPSPKDVLEQYTYLTGRMPIPPKWAIGYHQSRYSYETEQEVRELAVNFKKKQIPLDVIYLDIHYMNEYRVFTFDKDKFPNPKQMIADLKEMGIRIVPIVDPGVKQDAEYKIYQEGVYEDHFCKYIEGDYFFGDVWPGKSAFPDFTNSNAREWWGEKHKYYTDMGIEGVWNDMNEPSVFNESKTMDLNVMHDYDGDPRTHRELHNIYGFMMGKSTYEGMKKHLGGKRPFLLTRAGYSGIQRYATVWTGDNRSFWEHLQLSIPMVLNLGLSGIPFAGPDVGGFAHDSNGELLARWTQVGAFTPYFRNHCAIGFARQEPWSFGEKYENVIKKYIELRYQWLPHLYSLFAEAHRTGTPVMRPLMLEYPNDPETYNLYDQFMVGDSVIVAPILKPSTQHRVVYLPSGSWTDYWTGDVLEGGKHHLVKADLETLPIFIKQGSVIVNGEVKHSTEIKDQKVTLHLYYGNDTESCFKWYEDDGSTFGYENGNYSLTTLTIACEEKEIKIVSSKEGTYTSEISEMELIVHGAEGEVRVSLDGKELRLEKNKAILSLN
ncbi:MULTISPECIES: glycoside hydrolase family 31 protein [unclassified Bacillus (in: firmicutes)]|uniref:glycoside hydrolase family 31 protein n=1 Tax=unclassified Bacillus (in: firmicutes) TaxID=185979 RepID=UPI0008E64B0E|nr:MULTISPECIES: glycoside hydrolase family 31 protein [unclassified Bacillus (in: firmicutes)]SFA79175.1 alpha-glucosidase [Bacillus sp. UNCCL13]SFQ69130.1 alpha-glucosidase [Bacillus sp. cl95]